MSIIGIVAVDRNGAIGKDGKLPWHYSADLKHFKATTTGNACVMGYKTWLTLNRPLPDRLNLILSRTAEITAPENVIVFRDVRSVLSYADKLSCDLFVIGGEQVYESFLPYIQKWLVTEIPLTIADADTFVPKAYLDGFVQVDSTKLDEDLKLSTYVRVT